MKPNGHGHTVEMYLTTITGYLAKHPKGRRDAVQNFVVRIYGCAYEEVFAAAWSMRTRRIQK